MNRLAPWLAPIVVLAAAPSARAQAQFEVQTRLSSEQVEVNEPVEIQLRVSIQGGDANAEDPRLPVAAGVRVGSPTISPQSQISIINGRMLQSSAVVVRWRVLAQNPGKYRLGPPSISIGGKRVQGEAKVLEVLPQGTARRRPGTGRQPPDPFDLFDPFRGFPGFPNFPNFPFPFDEPPEEEQVPSYPPELAVSHAPDPVAFVITKATPTTVVVGQAVRFKVYAYGGRGRFNIQSLNEPSRAGFVAYQDSSDPTAYEVPIGGRSFIAAPIQSLVLFPVQTGTLRIGSVRAGFGGRNYRPVPPDTLLMRESKPLDIVVTEPPLAGRPPGYRLGDVGDYQLSATVDPPKIRQGESVSVVVRLTGTGNPPTRLDVPQQSGVEWPEPTYVDKIEANDGVVRGERTFTYVVRVDRAGQVDLGEIKLPFYNPDTARYAVARAALGTVTVAENPGALRRAQAASASQEDRLKGLLKPQRELRPTEAVRRPLTDHGAFWALLAMGPLGVLTANGLARVGKRLAQRWREQRDTPREHALREIAAAREAATRGDRSGTTSAVERAVHLALEAATGIKSRGVLRSELTRALADRGFPEDLAKEAVALLETTENARFVGEAGLDVAELAGRAGTFVQAALGRKRA